jgi:DNA modification methylase
VPNKAIASIQAKALRTGRKVTGIHATNRASRWRLPPTHPQYGTEVNCKIIFVRLCAQLFCFDSEAVYEPFSGSGTTIIAAEITGRKCHAIEPLYVDVAVKRWQNFTGHAAVLESDG